MPADRVRKNRRDHGFFRSAMHIDARPQQGPQVRLLLLSAMKTLDDRR
jgi:hypothetical protein